VRHIRHQGRNVEDHVLGAAQLDGLHGLGVAAHLGADLEVAHVEIGDDPRADRAERVEALGPRPLRVAALQVTGGHVVADGVAEDRFLGAGPVEAAGAGGADHDGELALFLDAVGLRGQPDRVVGTDHRGGRLDEDQRLFGHLVAELGRVVGVVAADPDDLAGEDRGEQADVGQRPALTGEPDLLERQRADLGDGQARRVTLDDAEGHPSGMNKTGESHGLIPFVRQAALP
jgi:hypothetical protein